MQKMHIFHSEDISRKLYPRHIACIGNLKVWLDNANTTTEGWTYANVEIVIKITYSKLIISIQSDLIFEI